MEHWSRAAPRTVIAVAAGWIAAGTARAHAQPAPDGEPEDASVDVIVHEPEPEPPPQPPPRARKLVDPWAPPPPPPEPAAGPEALRVSLPPTASVPVSVPEVKPPGVEPPGGRREPAAGPPEPARSEVETPEPGVPPAVAARAELSLGQTAGVAMAGVELCLALGCEQPAVRIAAGTAGGAAGFAASLWLSRDGIEPIDGQALNAGAAWGAFHGLMLRDLIGRERDASWLAGIAGQAGGMALGPWARRRIGLDADQLATASSFGIASAVVGAIAAGLAEPEGSRRWAVVTLAAADAGLAAGVLYARRHRIARADTLYLDLATLLGAAVWSVARKDSSDVEVPLGVGSTAAAFGAALLMLRDRRGRNRRKPRTWWVTAAPRDGGLAVALAGALP